MLPSIRVYPFPPLFPNTIQLKPETHEEHLFYSTCTYCSYGIEPHSAANPGLDSEVSWTPSVPQPLGRCCGAPIHAQSLAHRPTMHAHPTILDPSGGICTSYIRQLSAHNFFPARPLLSLLTTERVVSD